MVSFRSLTTGLGVECGSRAVKDRSSTGCAIKSKKTKMDPRGKITLKKKKSLVLAEQSPWYICY